MLPGRLHQIISAQATALLCLVAFLYSKVRWRAIRRLLTLIQSKPNHFSSSALPRQPRLLWRAKVGIFFFLHLIKAVKLHPLGALRIIVA